MVEGGKGAVNVPLAENGAMVITEPCPASHVVEASSYPLGQSVRNPVEARQATNLGGTTSLGDPSAEAAQVRS